MRILITIVFALVLHLTFGWAWTLGAGILGGALANRSGWLVGAAGVGGGWAILVAYAFVVASTPTQTMLGALGSLMGNIPGALVVAITVLLGVLIGGLGGVIGTQLAGLTGEDAPTPTPAG